MSDTEIIILIVIISFIIGIILFILSGLFHVKKDEVSVFEKLYSFYSTKEEGYYFFTPLLTKRVGNYSLKPQYIKINLEKESLFITYKICDAKLFHYNPKFNDFVLEKMKLCEINNLEYNSILNEISEIYGIKILDFRIKEK